MKMQLSKYLKTGDEFKESLRDDRTVYCKSQLIPDVIVHPATSGGIHIMAGIYEPSTTHSAYSAGSVLSRTSTRCLLLCCVSVCTMSTTEQHLWTASVNPLDFHHNKKRGD